MGRTVPPIPPEIHQESAARSGTSAARADGHNQTGGGERENKAACGIALFGSQMLAMAHPRCPRISHKTRPTRRIALMFCAALMCAYIGVGYAKSKEEYAADFKTQLIQKIMPYWYDTAIDRQNGGYLLSDDAAKKAPPTTEKQLVTQTRMIWGFSHV